VTATGQIQPVFGGFGTVTRLCRLVTEDRTWKALGVEVLGINLPKCVITRTWNETLDAGTVEFGNTLGFFGGLYVLNAMVDKTLKRLRIPVHPDPKILSRGRIMKSFALVSPLFAFMFAVPYFRNALTAWRSGTTDFRNLISKGDQAKTALVEAKSRQHMRHNLKKGLGFIAAGVALGLAGFVFFASAPARVLLGKAKPGTWLQKGQSVLKAACLRGKDGKSYDDYYALAYWGVPCYTGLIAASRDPFEVKEQALKMLNFHFMYLVPNKIIQSAVKNSQQAYIRRFPQVYPGKVFSYGQWAQVHRTASQAIKSGLAKALRFENTRILTDLGVTTALMAVFPTVLNIYLTQKRIERARMLERS